MKDFQRKNMEEIRLFEKRIKDIAKELSFKIKWFHNKAEFWLKELDYSLMVGTANLSDKTIYVTNKKCLIYFPLHYFQSGIKLLQVG